MTRIIRCHSCTRRVKGHHPFISLLDMVTGKKIASYHAHPSCQRQGAQEMASLMERGKAYILRHHHASTCPDERPGWNCSGGCFSPPLAEAN